jgi:hypothetical protein
MARGKLLRRAVALVVGVCCALAIHGLWRGQGARALAGGDSAAEDALARGVVKMVDRAPDSDRSLTGNARFDGEWRMVTEQMAALGLGQLVLQRPERRAEYLPVIARCVERLQAADVTAFGADAWGRRGFDDLESERGHAYLGYGHAGPRRGFDDLESERGHAYLGYANLAFGMLRLLEPGSAIGPLHDRVTAALARRLGNAPHAAIETYPGETYPPDVAAVAASIALHDRSTGPEHRALLERWSRTFFERYVDSRSGLLYQAVDANTGTPLGPARASGSAIAVYFLSFADDGRARLLFDAIERQRTSFLGFGAIREYPSGVAGSGDIDSGPLVFGVSPSASAFALAGARLYENHTLLSELMRTASLAGMPIETEGRLRFATGGAIGNAIVLAVLTARRDTIVAPSRG